MYITVIANGESALSTRCGSMINDCDIVVRMGRYITTGYESFVGTKTTIHGTARWKYTGTSDTNTWLVDDFDSDYNSRLVEDLKYDTDPLTINSDIHTHRPSIGTRILHRVILDYPAAKIHTKGFDFFNTGHYFNNNHMYTACSHPVVLERLYFEKLVHRGTVHPI